MNDLSHTLPPEDVLVQLQAGQPRWVSRAEKEALIGRGISYGELLTPEEIPSELQHRTFHEALERHGPRIGRLLTQLAAELLHTYPQPVLVSLARAGTPVGCALRRLTECWGSPLPHHTLSIIRGVGIDLVALEKVRAAHPEGQLIFIDGWTGKGSIFKTLKQSLPPDVPARLAVLSDPAGVAQHAATFDDLLLPHALLNATVCGLLSRTFLGEAGGLHSAVVEQHLQVHDLTAFYLQALDQWCAPHGPDQTLCPGVRPIAPQQEVLAHAARLGIHDPHRVKPGVGEATRAFLRRQPAHLLLRDAQHPDTRHLLSLAEMMAIPYTLIPSLPYLAAALLAPAGA